MVGAQRSNPDPLIKSVPKSMVRQSAPEGRLVAPLLGDRNGPLRDIMH
jgi:hypothetical protein